MINETPYWWATAPELPNYSDRPLPSQADVVVIGSGYTGLSAARTLAQRGASVVVLEKETIGWGASSRNGGQVLTGLAIDPAALIKRVGLERAKTLHAASLQGLDYIEGLISAEGIDCDFERVGHLEAACKPAHFAHFQQSQELLAREFNHSIRLLDRSQQHEELGTDYYHGVLIDERSAGVHPAKYVRGLAQAAERAGAQLHEKTPALALERGAAQWRVFTPRGPIGAREILVATNGYTDVVAPSFRGNASSRSDRISSRLNRWLTMSLQKSYRAAAWSTTRKISSPTSGCRRTIGCCSAGVRSTNYRRRKPRVAAWAFCGAA